MTAADSLGTQFDDHLPPEPGTAPIPKGHVRLWHYTPTENLSSIRKHGLTTSHARGETYGEPNQVWASAGMPKSGDFQSHNYVEFHADPSQLDIGSGRKASDLEARRSDVTMRGDVSPSQITAVHEPWHAHLRYLNENRDYYAEHPEFLKNIGGDEQLEHAIKVFKQQRRA